MHRHRRFALALSTCLVATVATAQSPDIAQAANPQTQPKIAKPAPPPGGITGTVFCADTHKPARSAMLMLARKPLANPSPDDRIESAQANQMTRVAMDGTYTFDKVPPGEYAVIAILPGYLSPLDDLVVDIEGGDNQEATLWKRSAEHGTVTVTSNQTARFNTEIDRGAAISGRVLYSDGSPASQVTIDLENTADKPAAAKSPEQSMNIGGLMRTMFTHQTRSTDDTGRFRVAGIAPGTYRVVALHTTAGDGSNEAAQAQAFNAMTGNTGNLRIYAGDTMHQKAAKTFTLRPGDEITGIDITVPVDAFHAVTGHVVSKDGRPLNMGKLLLTDKEDPTYHFEASVTAEGAFRFPAVSAGTYTLTLTEARIGAPITGDGPMARYMPLTPKSAFADTSQDVIVGDKNTEDINITATEIPLPPPPKDQAPTGFRIPD